jgi:hypothetical protein
MDTTFGEPTTRFHAGDDPDITVVELTAQPPIHLQLLEQFTVAGGLLRLAQPNQCRGRVTAGGAQL